VNVAAPVRSVEEAASRIWGA